ncbi:type-F conjugative transfer system protein TraW [Arsenophonus sp. ENCA]|uniref:type-F conjugative transfer system protein TraW n=1 Tax=Arsenophonus sp. ENCA TaxID=1987579 RepID=UPI000BD4EDB7|nr:type-F conjugative transfer system protein TraW [Arsenophonus sp. ENCA]PAV10515.1 type-F conjugative transfer system protein TraW [Arsenophonus sp. ENCA]
MNKWLLCFLFLTNFSAISLATEIGTFGDVWGVAEQNLLTVIEGQVESTFLGNEEKIHKEWRELVTKNAERPEPLQGLTKAVKNTTRTFDPSFTVTKNIRDHNGIVFACKGQKVNPFDITPFNETLYFIDGDDEKQLAWVAAQKPATAIQKIILVNGNIKTTAETLNQRIYFDQGGVLVNRFGIEKLPSVVDEMPNQSLLRITEVAVK